MTMNDQRLAAIMFTDIVGYTSLMADDEHIALEIVSKQRDVLQPLIQSHRGQWLKEMGDGTLSSFSSATSAVQCAIEIQNQLKPDPSFKIRIGIHLGDVMFTETDVFGDGVNIAARIEPNAEPGGIAVSGSVYDTLSNNKHFQTVLLGEKTLKNIGRPLRIYAIGNDDLPVGKTFVEPLAKPLSTPLSTPSTDRERGRFKLGTIKTKPLIWSAAAIIALVFAGSLNLQSRPIAISGPPSASVLESNASEPADSGNALDSIEDSQSSMVSRSLAPGEQGAEEAISTAEALDLKGAPQNPVAAATGTEVTALNNPIRNTDSDDNSLSSSGLNEPVAAEEDAETQIVLSEPAFVSPTQPGLVIASDSVPVQTLNTTEKPPAAVLESPIAN